MTSAATTRLAPLSQCHSWLAVAGVAWGHGPILPQSGHALTERTKARRSHSLTGVARDRRGGAVAPERSGVPAPFRRPGGPLLSRFRET